MKCLMCSVLHRARRGELEDALFGVVSLFVLVSRKRMDPTTVVDSLCCEHSKELAHLVFKTKSSMKEHSCKIIPLPARKE